MFIGTAFSGTVVALPTTCKRERERERERETDRDREINLGEYMNLHVYGSVCEYTWVWARDFNRILRINSDYSPKERNRLDFLLRTCNLGPNLCICWGRLHATNCSHDFLSQIFEILVQLRGKSCWNIRVLWNYSGIIYVFNLFELTNMCYTFCK